MSKSPYNQAVKDRKRKKARRKVETSDKVEKWRTHRREAGPVRFAEEVLTCPPDVPPHPDLGKVPEFVILSEDQKEFLTDLWKRNVTLFILAAGRGAGKTFCLAIYATWRLCCYNNFTLTVMGGSGEQSEKIKEYVDFWRRRDKNIDYCLYRSVASGNRPARVESRWDSYARFPACSEASARGPHVTQLMIDEVCVAESKGKGGAGAVRSARYQLTSSSQSLLGMTSTAQYILGTFYEVWTNAEDLGYKRYRWAIARHTSEAWYLPNGKPNWDYIDEVLYKDKNPDHWIPNVWWMTERDVHNFRKGSSNDEWLVEILGGISKGSGLVFSRDDLRACICNGRRWTGKECEVCEPYTENCPMMKKLGITLPMISDRKGGVDFGEIAPNAMTVTGKRGEYVFVLYSDERTGLRDEEVLEWILKNGKKWKLWEILADPEARSMREAIENAGYSAPNIWAGVGGDAKRYFVKNVNRFVEKHNLIVPMEFTYLISSMNGLAYDDKGRIRKHNDHSFDSLVYSMRDYSIDDLYNPLTQVKKRGIGKIW